jgi:hypothetical protein
MTTGVEGVEIEERHWSASRLQSKLSVDDSGPITKKGSMIGDVNFGSKFDR